MKMEKYKYLIIIMKPFEPFVTDYDTLKKAQEDFYNYGDIHKIYLCRVIMVEKAKPKIYDKVG